MKIFARNKKGSLSLSMEAIVILILAIVMLGLGLTFVRSMFGNISRRANEAVDLAILDRQPSEGEPVVFSPARLEVRERQMAEIVVGFYNSHTTEERWLLEISDVDGNPCGPGNPCYENFVPVTYRTMPFNLDKDQSVAWYVIFEPEDGAVASIVCGEGVSTCEAGTAARSTPALFTVKFCGVGEDDDGSDGCPDDATAVYQRELFMTIRR